MPNDASKPPAPRALFAAIIGAGPAGAAAALELARARLGPVALLDRAPFPRVKPCGSGLSSTALRQLHRLGLRSRVDAQAYPIHGARLEAPSRREARLVGEADHLVLARERLDGLLVDAAREAGATFHDGVRVRRIAPQPDGSLRVVTERGPDLQARWVIVATGAAGALAGSRLPPGSLVTYTGWYRGVEFEPHLLELVFDRELAPHYGWLFPEGPDQVNIGVCLDARHRRGRPMAQLFAEFLERHLADRMREATPVRPPRGHPIAAASRVITPDVPSGTLVVGEAARLANRATGEGIALALRSGALAARAIEKGHDRHWPREQVHRYYGAALRRQVGPELLLAHQFTRFTGPALEATAWLSQSRWTREVVRRVLAHLQ